MSQNPQINTTQPFSNNGFGDASQLNQSSNVLYNDNTTATSDNSHYGTTPMTSVGSTSQSYPAMSYSNNVSTEQVSTQNFAPSAVNISSSLPSYMTTSSGIIIYEIPGYDIIYIPSNHDLYR